MIRLPAISPSDANQDVDDLHKQHQHVLAVEDSLHGLGQSASDGSSPSSPVLPTWCEPSTDIVVEPATSSISTPCIAPRELAIDQGERLFAIFRRKASFFPFVTLPEKATVKSLSRDLPFLLLAILTSSSIGDQPLHQQLDNEFKRVLSDQVIVGGKRSLELLQGILVYVAW